MATIANLVVNIRANNAELRGAMRDSVAVVKQAEKEMGGFAKSAGGIKSVASSMAPALVAVGAGAAGVMAAFKGIAVGGKLAADLEQLEVAFGTMLGPGTDVKKLMGELSAFSAATPFQFPELADASRKLAAFGTKSEQLVPTLRVLGDLSAGVGQPVAELAELYGKAQVQGRLFGEDINQLTGRGIPVIGEFAKQFGVSQDQVKKLVEQGKIGFPQLQQAFIDLTADGGKFGGLMAKQSTTLGGLVSTLKDNVSLALRDIVGGLMEAVNFKGMIASLISVTDWIRTTAVPLIGGAFQTLGTMITEGFGAVSSWLQSTFGVDVGQIFTNFSDLVTTAFLTAEFVATRWRDALSLYLLEVSHRIVRAGNVIMHTLTVALPTYLDWFKDNWRDVFFTLFDFTSTVFINLGQNIRNAMSEIWDFIKSGGTDSVEIAWTPLTEGFVNTIRKLPEVAAREIGPLEASLGQEVAALSKSLSDDLGKHITSRKASMAAAAKAGAAATAGPTVPKMEVQAAGLAAATPKGEKKEQDNRVAAAERGSAEAFSAIFRTRGMGQKDQPREKTQAAMLAEMKEVNRQLRSGQSTQIVAGTL